MLLLGKNNLTNHKNYVKMQIQYKNTACGSINLFCLGAFTQLHDHFKLTPFLLFSCNTGIKTSSKNEFYFILYINQVKTLCGKFTMSLQINKKYESTKSLN